MRNANKMWWSALNGDKVPRKAKKVIFGNKMKKSQLRRLLDNVVVVENKYPEPATILPYPFCPKCGCKYVKWTGNMVEYPELYDRGYCVKCGFLVGLADNSPYIHALERKEDDYELN